MEEWRDVPGYEGVYQVSIQTKEGKLRRIYKNGNIRVLTGVKKREHQHFRVYWSLWKDSKATMKQAARWIAMTYPELVQNEYFEGAEIDHIDTDPMNNHPSNLRWVTRKGNINNPLTKIHFKEKVFSDEHRKHLSVSRRGKKLSEDHKKRIGESKSRWVIKLSLKNEILHFYKSTREAERETGVRSSGISACCNNKIKQSGGYIWKYAE